MDLNLFKNIKKDIESNINVKNFIEELGNFLNNCTSSKKDNVIQEYRKEGHLYLVTEDRGNEVYLMDFTEKSKHEFKETGLSKELLDVAKEGAMLQYKNGEYTLYSKHGYDILFNEENNINNTIK